MLRAEIHDSANSLGLKLEGRFAGEAAENTRPLVKRCGNGMKMIIDITEVTFIDPTGEEVLSFFGRFGAEFVAQTSYTLDVCERLRLRLAQGGALGMDTTGASRKSGNGRRAHTRQPENKDI